MVKTAGVRERNCQCILAAMSKRWMAKVMRQAQGLGQILVKPEDSRHRSPDLRHLDGMSQPNAKMVTVGRNEHLRLVTQPAEGDRVDDPVPIALKRIALATRSAIIFPKNPAARS
jgi:hypothetical protein